MYLYKYVTADTAKAIISSRALRWSSPLCFNDPFDVPQRARLNFTMREMEDALKERLERAIKGEEQLSDPYFAPVIEMIRKTDNSELRTSLIEGVMKCCDDIEGSGEIGDFWRGSLGCIRVLCLSEVNDSLPCGLTTRVNTRALA
jgi:hypothetical protein